MTFIAMGPKHKKDKDADKKKGKESKQKPIILSNDDKSPPRKSSHKRKAPEKYGVEDELDITPEKKPVHSTTPRKSKRSKDRSPPPLRHRQNRMPEQVELVKDCK